MLASLRARLFAANLGLLVLGLGSLTLWAGQQMARSTWDDYGNGQRIYALFLANQLVEPLDESPAEAAAVLRRSAENLDARLALFSADGRYTFGTVAQPDALVPTDGYTVRDGAVWTSAEIIYEQERIGYVQVVTSADTPQRTIRQRWAALGAGFAVFSLAGIAVTAWLLTSLTRPLDRLRRQALQIADGDLSRRLTDLPRNEIGAVGAAFNTMADRVEALLDEQRAFAGNASHELRTPLTTIRLRTEALKDGVPPDLAQRYIDEIDAEAGRLGRLVDDLLLLSRLDARRLEAGAEQIDVGRVLQLLHQELLPAAQAKGIAFALDVPTQPVVITATLSHAQVVLRNVVDNALKFTPAHGRVMVTLTEVATSVRVEVSDTGRGIAPEHRPHIGKRFYRTDKSRNRSVAGTGLGLALTASILELYGGTLAIDSPGVDQGARVVIHWPRTHHATPDAAARAASASPAG